MKRQALFLIAGLIAAQTSQAQVTGGGGFGQRRSCSEQSRLLSDVLSRSSSATSRLGQNLNELDRLANALRAGAQTVGTGQKVDIRRELESSVSYVEQHIRAAQNSVQSALADLRNTPNQGSHAYTLAGIAAGKLDSAKQSAQTAERGIDALKGRIDQVQQLVNGNGGLQGLKQNVQQGLQSLQRLEQAFAGLSELGRISSLSRDYTTYCSSQTVTSCFDIRSNLDRSADQLYNDAREVESASFDVRSLRSEVSQIASGLGNGQGGQFDLHTILQGIIHSESLPYLQDGFNNMAVAAQQSREASTSPSGVRFDELVREAIPGSERALRLTEQSLTGLNSLRISINQLAIQIANSSSTNVSAFQLQQAAGSVTMFNRRVDLVARRLGTVGWSSGDLGTAYRYLDDHRRYCEISAF
jgi:hypothetical protein